MDDAARAQAMNPADDLAQLTKDPLPTFTDEVLQFEGGKFKEQMEALAGKINSLERSAPVDVKVNEIQEVPTNPELEEAKEIAGYVEAIEKEAELTTPVTDDYTNQVLLKSANPQDVVVTLPLTADQIQQGLHHKVWEAITWLAVWCFRQVKLLHGRVKYKA